jgi:hypothetical protein
MEAPDFALHAIYLVLACIIMFFKAFVLGMEIIVQFIIVFLYNTWLAPPR